jgi:hypothetical protein
MNDDLLRQNPGRDFHWILQCRNALDKLFMDPWFTSLWTLQEAFLCPHAYLLPREAEHIPMIQSMLLRISNTGSLSGLSAICDLLQKACEKVYTTMLIVDDFLVHRSNLTDIQTMLRDRGLSALVTGNPIALYGVASFRRTRKDVDRVYGIEQVFELRLGASASGSQSSRTYTRLRLETQLGAKILEKLPVLSQIHNFNEPVELGRGWRISSASRIPAIDLHINIASAKHTPACQLSVSRIARGEMGTYKGMITSFNQLRLAWSQAPLASGVQESDGSRSLQQICLDVFLNHKKFEFSHIPSEELGPEGFEVTYPAVWGFQRDIRRGIEQHELAAWLTTRLEELHQGKALVVLLLGSFLVRKTELHGAEAYNVGLILLESELHGTSYWRRLGFCLWQYDLVGLNSEAANILRAVEGQGNWKYTEGLFG